MIASMTTVKLSPSMMCADFLHLADDLDVMAAHGVEYLHIDIMDGHYVPNFTLGPDYCRALARWGRIPLDIHLMIEGADTLAKPFLEFTGSVLVFHPETVYHPVRTVQMVRDGGVRPGIVVSPSVTVEQIMPLLPYVDLVCVMTVNPGYAGQKLIPEMLAKLTQLRDWRERSGLSFEIEVDGNVSWEHIPAMVRAGGEVLVAGTSSLFRQGEGLGDNIQRFRNLVAENRNR
jgi:ribulose-phosphate 3-epimerase